MPRHPVLSKKENFSFSLTKEDAAAFLKEVRARGYSSRNEFFLDLLEAIRSLDLRPAIGADNRRVLRPYALSVESDVASELRKRRQP
jgi:hypothetical protein